MKMIKNVWNVILLVKVALTLKIIVHLAPVNYFQMKTSVLQAVKIVFLVNLILTLILRDKLLIVKIQKWLRVLWL